MQPAGREIPRDGETEARVGDGVFCIASVQVIAGVSRRITEIFSARTTVFALAARPAKPGHPNPVALLELVHSGAGFHNPTDDLVTEDEREFRLCKLAIDDVEIGPADAARRYLNQNLARAGFGRGTSRSCSGSPGACRTIAFTVGSPI